MTGSRHSAPFLRWAGGKRWFCHKLKNYLPSFFTDYYEPFLGGGAVFFYLKSQGILKHNIFLSDYNEDLITAYDVVKNHVKELCDDLSAMDYSEDEYYKIRESFNSGKLDKYQQGLSFIYLNLASFNGIYRVNRDGRYNVPYGCRKGYPNGFSSLLLADSQSLQLANLKAHSFEEYLNDDFHFKKGSFIFLDPPYTVSHNNNGFIAYNKNLFDLEHQYILRKLADKINADESFFVMTNARHQVIKEIFDGYYFNIEERASLVGGTVSSRTRTQEYIISNFKGDFNG